MIDLVRLRALHAVATHGTVTNAARALYVTPSAVSQHLAKLRMARLVCTRRAGTTIFYTIENEHVRQLVNDAVFNAEHAGPGVPAHHRGDVSPLPSRKAGG